MERRSNSQFGRRLLVLLLAFLVAIPSLATFSAVAVAQYRDYRDPPRRGFFLFDMFRPRQPDGYYDQRYDRYQQQRQRPAPAKRKVARTRPAAPVTPPAPEAVQKQETAKTVLVVGDFLSGGLAEGLADAYAQNPDIKVVDRSNGSSGFVRDDYYDWTANIGKLIADTKPAAVVMMAGSNDRQQIKSGDSREQPGTDGWTRRYEARVAAFTAEVERTKVPLFWVGMPSFKSSAITADMLALNEIYEANAESAGATFIDIWDGFVDENGVFITSGADINGQIVRLRNSDGIGFAKAGKRKAAFYVEKPLAKLLGTDGKMPDNTTPALLPPVGATEPKVIDRTPPIAFTDPELDGGMELMGGGTAPPRFAPNSIAEQLLVKGLVVDGQAGRADAFAAARVPVTPATASTESEAAETATAAR